jgi:hypothetical protein
MSREELTTSSPAVSSEGVVWLSRIPDAVFQVKPVYTHRPHRAPYFWVPLCVGVVFFRRAFIFKVLVLDPRRRKGTGVLIETP